MDIFACFTQFAYFVMKGSKNAFRRCRSGKRSQRGDVKNS